jgi:hypothetical protein
MERCVYRWRSWGYVWATLMNLRSPCIMIGVVSCISWMCTKRQVFEWYDHARRKYWWQPCLWMWYESPMRIARRLLNMFAKWRCHCNVWMSNQAPRGWWRFRWASLHNAFAFFQGFHSVSDGRSWWTRMPWVTVLREMRPTSKWHLPIILYQHHIVLFALLQFFVQHWSSAILVLSLQSHECQQILQKDFLPRFGQPWKCSNLPWTTSVAFQPWLLLWFTLGNALCCLSLNH